MRHLLKHACVVMPVGNLHGSTAPVGNLHGPRGKSPRLHGPGGKSPRPPWEISTAPRPPWEISTLSAMKPYPIIRAMGISRKRCLCSLRRSIRHRPTRSILASRCCDNAGHILGAHMDWLGIGARGQNGKEHSGGRFPEPPFPFNPCVHMLGLCSACGVGIYLSGRLTTCVLFFFTLRDRRVLGGWGVRHPCGRVPRGF